MTANEWASRLKIRGVSGKKPLASYADELFAGAAVGNEIDAVINALRVAIKEAEKSHENYWPLAAGNRWINRLPGAWLGRWRDLKLKSEYLDIIERKAFLSHFRATLAYLEAHRDEIRRMRLWSRAPSGHAGEEPIDAEFSEVKPKQLDKSVKQIRVIK